MDGGLLTRGGGGSLNTGTIIGGSLVNGRVNDAFTFIFVFGWYLGVSR